MISFEEALQTTLNQAVGFGTETISFEEVPGRVLAETIRADRDIPPFHKSAMDGFACRREDLPGPVKVIEVIPAGYPPQKSVMPGTCSQIMTGAILPVGADTVIRVEECEVTAVESDPDSRSVLFTGQNTPSNICVQGEDLHQDEVVLEPGTLLSVRHIPILATVGHTLVKVTGMPTVGVLSTGTELVEPGLVPGISQIRNTNAYQIIGQLAALGIDCDYYGIAPDDEASTRDMIREALENCNIVILSGGISMGEFDFVPAVLKDLGISMMFREIAIQPGKPTLFGTGDGKFVFGLPGNPVSSYFLFELLIRPFIYRCMGHDWSPPVIRIPTANAIRRKKGNRLGWVPVRIDAEGKAVPVDYHGSAHILALGAAFGIIPFPIGKTVIEEGETVDVRPL